MRNLLRAVMALSLGCFIGTCAYGASSNYCVPSNFGSDSLGSQLSFDSFHNTIKKRLQAVRVGAISTSIPRRPVNYGPTYGPTYGPSTGAPYGTVTPGYAAPMNGGEQMLYQNNPSGYGAYPPVGGTFQNTGTYQAPMQQTYQPVGGYEQQPVYGTGYSSTFASDEAYAMAPSSRSSSVASARRRQLDCVYYSGFTVWADLYQTFGKQNAKGREDGYKYRTFGPALGFDWTSGNFTIGAATTYNFGKMKDRNYYHDRRLQTFAIDLYGQYNSDIFYVNGSIGYAHNSFKSDRTAFYIIGGAIGGANHDKYNSNAFDIEGEFGWKFNWSGLNVTPHAGLRFFHDRRGSIDEGGASARLHLSSENYHVLEVPIGVRASYEINTGSMLLVPRANFAWIPTINRKGYDAVGTIDAPDPTGYINGGGYRYNSVRRARHGFQLGVGMEAKITRSISAHLDYQFNFRSKAREHYWNLGVGFTF